MANESASDHSCSSSMGAQSPTQPSAPALLGAVSLGGLANPALWILIDTE